MTSNHRLFKTIMTTMESEYEWMASRATALLAAQIKYNICHGIIHTALMKVYRTATRNNNDKVFTEDSAVTKSIVDRYIVKAARILGSFDAQQDRKCVPQVV